MTASEEDGRSVAQRSEDRALICFIRNCFDSAFAIALEYKEKILIT